MKKECQILKIKSLIGRKISNSNRKNKKSFDVNLKNKKIYLRKKNLFIKKKISTKAIKYIDKNEY